MASKKGSTKKTANTQDKKNEKTVKQEETQHSLSITDEVSNKNAENLFQTVTLQKCDDLVPPPAMDNGGNGGSWSCGNKFNIQAAQEDMKLNTGWYWSTAATKTIAGCSVGKAGHIGKSSNSCCTPSVAGHITMGGIIWSGRCGYGFEMGQFLGNFGWNKLSVQASSINTYAKMKEWTSKNAIAGDVCVQTNGASPWTEATKKSLPGHVCMYDGTYWVSDFQQRNGLVYGDGVVHNNVEIYRFSDCKYTPGSNSGGGGGAPSSNAKLDTSKKALLITGGKGMNRAYPNGDQASWTQTLVQDVSFQYHDENGQVKTMTKKINKYIVNDFKSAMAAVFNLQVNGKYFQLVQFGTYNHRCVKRRGGGCGTKLSYHSYGVAFDINWSTYNPWVGERNPSGNNTERQIRKNHPIIATFEKYGFGWGGSYGDTMHFSYMGGDA